MLTVTAHKLGETVILRCRGRLVRGEESALLCAAVRRYGSDLIIDLTGVSVIDAAGVGALVALQAAGVYLKLVNPAEPVRTVLRVTGLDSMFEICQVESVEDLLLRPIVAQAAGPELIGARRPI